LKQPAFNKLVIAEKPSVAKSIAAVLGATERRDGNLTGNGYIVSWCFGHLVELAPPTAYGEQYKRWSLDTLPILPKQWQYTAQEDKGKQLEILRALMNSSGVDSIVCATDAGREGELIFRLTYNYCKCTKPVKRLWISSMEDAAIRDGFAKLRDSADYDALYRSALCRAQADFIVGINATRLFSCLYRGSTLNVGRVQSPTLAMIVARDAAISAFTPVPFYTPEIDCGSFKAVGERLENSAAAEAVRSDCDGKDCLALSVEKQERTIAPPKLYDLTTLQREANRLFGFTAQQTLDCAQALYEKKLLSYPRTDSRYLTSDMKDTAGTIATWLMLHLPYTGDRTFAPDIDRVINDSGVSDHHALIPTAEYAKADLEQLPSAERDLLNLVALRLLCAVAPPHTFETVTALFDCNNHNFTAKGKTVLRDGWKAFDTSFREALKNKQDSEESGEDDKALPEISEGQLFSAVKASVREGRTTAPRPYTEDTLLAAMENAGAEEMPLTERKGLGTPATRAGVIEKLVKSGFVERSKRQLHATQKGVNLIAVLPETIISPLLTAEWETKLKQVERGELSADEFMIGIDALTKGLVADHSAPLPEYVNLFAAPPKGAVTGKCPRCGADVTENSKGFFCSSRACKFALWKDSRFWAAKGKTLSKTIAAALLKEGRVSFSDLKSQRTGKTYSATVVLVDTENKTDYKLEFEKGEIKK
jgi:DNA topoisomerase-3